MADGYVSDSSSDNEIKITIIKRDFSKMTPEELAELDKKLDQQVAFCVYCNSMGKEARGHSKENCRLLQNTRCNWCGDYGHTGKFCEKKGDKPLEIRCLFCFRGKKDERFYMSHSIENCRFRREYDGAYRQPKQKYQQSNTPKPIHEEGFAFFLEKKNVLQQKVEEQETTILTCSTDPILAAFDYFENEMKKPQPKLYEPTSPAPMTENEYLMYLHRQNQMMLANLRIKK